MEDPEMKVVEDRLRDAQEKGAEGFGEHKYTATKWSA
jgi:hypothetical protein